MRRLTAQMFAALASALVCGCASAPADIKPDLVSNSPSPPLVTGSLPDGTYQLSDEELKFECSKLTGLMQIRILQVRGYDSNRQASLAARGMQSFATPIWGGTKEGLDPDAQYRRDLAMLQAYNQRLASKQCQTFDLTAELATTDDATPAPH